MDDEKDKKNSINDSEQVVETKEEFAVYKDDNPQDFLNPNQSIGTELLQQSEEKVKSQRTNKSKLINALFFCVSVVVLVVILIYQYRKYGIKDVGDLLSNNVHIKGIGLILLTFIGIMLCDSFRTHILLYKATGIHRPIISYKSTAICRYYDCITPFSFGGQPFQIYYLNTRGVNGGIATSVPMAKYMFSQISFCFIALIMLIVGSGTYGESSSLVVTISIISLSICLLFLFLITFASLSKKIAPSIIIWFLKLLNKIKLIKNYNKTYRKTIRSLIEYQRSIKFYLGSFWVTILTLLASVAMVLLKALIPFLIYSMLSETIEVGFSIIFCKFVICELATMYIPLPGGAGMAEISFTALFASLFSDGLLFWAMLIYRIASYYIYLLQGFVVIIYDLVAGDRRDKKYKETKLVELTINAKNKRELKAQKKLDKQMGREW